MKEIIRNIYYTVHSFFTHPIGTTSYVFAGSTCITGGSGAPVSTTIWSYDDLGNDALWPIKYFCLSQRKRAPRKRASDIE